MDKKIKYYYTLWVAQLISALGSGLSGYALSIWIYRETGLVSRYSIISIITVLPGIILGPFAGVLVDMFSRKKIMLLCDTICGICTGLLAIVVSMGSVNYGYLYILLSLISIFAAVRWAAYASSIILLVQGDMLKKANGLDQMVNALSQLFPPIVAVLLISIINIKGIILIDFVTYILSVICISFIKIQNQSIQLEEKTIGAFMKEFKFGLSFLKQQRVLLGLLIYMAMLNFVSGSMNVLYTPLILSFASQNQLSLIMGFAGIGMIVGSIFISINKKLEINAKTILKYSYLFLLAFTAAGLFESVIFAALTGFVFFMCISIIGAVFQIIFQANVPVNLQGRIFSVRKMLITSTIPLSYFIVGFIADYGTKPLLREGGALAGSLGKIYGVGESRGIGLLIILLGLVFLGLINVIYKLFNMKELDSKMNNGTNAVEETNKIDTEETEITGTEETEITGTEETEITDTEETEITGTEETEITDTEETEITNTEETEITNTEEAVITSAEEEVAITNTEETVEMAEENLIANAVEEATITEIIEENRIVEEEK